MRIVGGRLKGRRLLTPRDLQIRPTTDRIRETLFNIVEHSHFGSLTRARVLDLCAGTGALGIEALSRGAAYAHFVEVDAAARGLIRSNLDALGLSGVAKIYRRDAAQLGPIGTLVPFDLVLCDPPYGRGLGDKMLAALVAGGWLKEGALIIVEETVEAAIEPQASLTLLDERVIGATKLAFFRGTS